MNIEVGENVMIVLNVWIIVIALAVFLTVTATSCNTASVAKWRTLTTNGYSQVQVQGSSCTMWQKEAK